MRLSGGMGSRWQSGQVGRQVAEGCPRHLSILSAQQPQCTFHGGGSVILEALGRINRLVNYLLTEKREGKPWKYASGELQREGSRRGPASLNEWAAGGHTKVSGLGWEWRWEDTNRWRGDSVLERGEEEEEESDTKKVKEKKRVKAKKKKNFRNTKKKINSLLIYSHKLQRKWGHVIHNHSSTWQ